MKANTIYPYHLFSLEPINSLWLCVQKIIYLFFSVGASLYKATCLCVFKFICVYINVCIHVCVCMR